jgi:sporulation protein YlmC with PRC-barrel domain
MTTDRPVTLVRLSDTRKTPADPTDDIRDRTVRDRDGNDIGKVHDLLVDTEERRVRFLLVEHGGILGFGATPSFIPVEAVARIDDDVHIDQSTRQVADAPRYDPDLVNQPDPQAADYYGSIYGYYGYPAFWLPGPVAPPPPPTGREDPPA